jgi:hypothetical protein
MEFNLSQTGISPKNPRFLYFQHISYSFSMSPGNPRHKNLFLGRYMMFVIIISSFIYSSGFIVHISLNICCGLNTQLFLFSNYVAVLMCLYSSSCYKDTTLSLTTV